MSGVSNWRNINLNFKVFENRKDFIKQGLDAISYVSKNITQSNYSSTVKKSNLVDMIDEKIYENERILKESMDFFEEMTAQIDMGGVFKKSRLKITDDKRGIFDFGIASKGLYNPREYFSQQLADELPDEFADEQYGNKPSGIVPVNFVKEEYVLTQKQFWYISFTNSKKYLLTTQAEGTRAIELGLPGARKVFKTSVKKSYVMFEKKGGKAKMVELYIPLHWSINLVNAMPLFLVAKFLQFYGVMTRISIVRVYEEGYNEFVAWGYPIKDYGEDMDFNFMALNAVDKRWWYSVQTVVRAMNERRELDKARGGSSSKISRDNFKNYDGSGGPPSSRKDYIEMFSRYRNWYMEEIKEGRLKPLRVDKKLMLIGGNFTASGRPKNNFEQIKEEFFRILDTVDFQFNKPEATCERIYKRLVVEKLDEYYQKLAQDKKNTPQMIVREMNSARVSYTATYKTYVQELLIATYTYPEGGMYPEPKESADKLEDELDEKLKGLNQFLKSL